MIDKDQKEKPFIVNYTVVNGNTFSFYGLDLLYGNSIPEKKDEVVISRSFADKAFCQDNPIGSVIHLTESVYDFDNGIRDYRVVNVAGRQLGGFQRRLLFFCTGVSSGFY